MLCFFTSHIYIWDISTLEWVAYPFSGGSSNPGIELKSPALQADALPSEPPGKSCFCSLISNHIHPANNSFPINIP